MKVNETAINTYGCTFRRDLLIFRCSEIFSSCFRASSDERTSTVIHGSRGIASESVIFVLVTRFTGSHGRLNVLSPLSFSLIMPHAVLILCFAESNCPLQITFSQANFPSVHFDCSCLWLSRSIFAIFLQSLVARYFVLRNFRRKYLSRFCDS